MSSIEASALRPLKWPEALRVLILLAAAFAVTSPFLTSRQIGGVDARWYAFALRGFTDQIGSGHFPVPVGQGEFAWNGGVHPLRSAPVYVLVGGLWKILTLGILGIFTVEHLTVLTSAVVGVLGFYAASAGIMPGRRWAAAGVALLYLGTPSWLSVIYRADAYMSYMAFGAMPLLLYGNARTVLKRDGRGFVALGAGLALVWMCHPPIALLCSITTLVVQTGRAIAWGFDSWRPMAAGALTFAVLSAYYFASMSELPPIRDATPVAPAIAQLLALSLCFLGLGRLVLQPRNLAWPACAVLGATGIWLMSPPWFFWILLTAAIWFGFVGTAIFVRKVDVSRHAVAVFFLCALAGAAASEAVLGKDHAGLYGSAIYILAVNASAGLGLLKPLPASMNGIAIGQFGWGLDLVLAAGAVALLGKRPLGAKIFFAASLGLVACFLRVPLLSNFLVGYFPVALSSIIAFPLAIRIAPVIAGFTAMSGVLWIATIPRGGPAAMRIVYLVLAAAVVWSGFEAAKFVRIGYSIVAAPSVTERNLRSENFVLERFSYDLLPLPGYFTNGVTDPMLESRLLYDSSKVIIGPKEVAGIMEGRGVKRISLKCVPISYSPTWFDIAPKITVLPGEHLLLRFEFDAKRDYTGWLVLGSEHCYREYHLPDSGQGLAFGVGGHRGDVISLWNSGDTPEHYSLSMNREPGNSLEVSGGLFATLFISTLDPAALPIRLESLDPYRASVSSATGGWLETFRVDLPGYRASVDGSPSATDRSRQLLLRVRVPPGKHEVEVRYVGTARLWLSAALSVVGWVTLVVLSVLQYFRARIGPVMAV